MNVLALAAITIDGFIAKDEHQSPLKWSTKADLKFYISKSTEAYVVIMGRRTFDTFKTPLQGRRLIVWTHNPEEVTTDGVEATSEEPAELIKRLENEGVTTVAVSGGSAVYRHFLEAGVIDELYLSVIPKAFGTGVSLFDAAVEQEFTLVESKVLEDDQTVLLHYKTVKLQAPQA